MIAKEKFLEKYNITEDLLLSAEISWDDLCEIYEDFCKNKFDRYDNIREEFVDRYLKNINKNRKDNGEEVKVHSYLSRVKDPEHLIAKIIRKKQEKYRKYKKLDKTNYEKFITDLIGIRCLVLFKADWTSFHNYIISQFENNVDYYIKDSILDFDEDEEHFYIAEKPKVHIRNGDAREIYDELLPPDCVIDGKVYRSVHYIIKYKGVYLEIQVRTLFEEGWGEIDHSVVYPYFQNDQILKEYTELLNRLSGLADEMGSFFYRLKKTELEYLKNKGLDIKDLNGNQRRAGGLKEKPLDSHKSLSSTLKTDTPLDCLKSILDE